MELELVSIGLKLITFLRLADKFKISGFLGKITIDEFDFLSD